MDFRIIAVVFPILLALSWAGYNIGRAALGQIQLALLDFKKNTSDRWKFPSGLCFFLIIYIMICAGVLVLSSRQSIPQPTGLLVVAMVVTPLIVSICGGLPTDCLRKADWFNGIIVLAGEVDPLFWFNQVMVYSPVRECFSMSEPKVVGYQNGLHAWPGILLFRL